jgi:hypothetical protein
MRTSDLLHQLADTLESEDNAILVRACDHPEMTSVVAEALVSAAAILKNAAATINDYGPDVTEDDLEAMATVAAEFDKSGDPLLQKQAAVLDEILIGVSADRGLQERFKAAQEAEIERLREKYRAQHRDDLYSHVKKTHDLEHNMAGEGKAADAVAKRIKEYRPMEAPLSTRYCPDHPGEQMMRIADSVYQCNLDKNVYNYEAGYTTMAGNQVPGSGVSNQTQHLGHQAQEHMNFSTREEVLNNNQ